MMESSHISERFSGVAADCYSCVLNQARSASRLAGLSAQKTDRIIAAASGWLDKSKSESWLVQHIIRFVEDEVVRQCSKEPGFDIYAEVKKQSNDRALAYAGACRDIIAAADEPLCSGLQIAAAGNIIDFGAKDHTSLDLEKELQELNKAFFDRFDIQSFEQFLKGASTLLYLCDNCGEIVFDMLFMEQLLAIYPNLRITAALREKPIINDATLEDAERLGLDLLVRTISSGSVYPGTIMAETTPEFRDVFQSADVIVAKGQGNFETLLNLRDSRLFFLLRIKCEYMASLAGVKKDSLVLMQGC